MLELHQKQELQQKLSPQQIQYIKLLQLNTLDLEQRIKDELEENPLLEEGLDDEERRREEEIEANTSAESENEVETEDVDDEEFDVEDLLNSSDDLYGYKASPGYNEDDDDRERPMPSAPTLAERLSDQLSFLDLSDTDQLIAEQIIGSIDEDGYLRRPVESILDDILFNHGVDLTEADVERVLRQVQSLDPAGIAARDLQECLLLQLYRMPEDVEGRAVAIEMLERQYKAFTMKHFGKLKKRLDVDDRTLKTAFELIQNRLDPKPGEGTFSEETNYITPDFTVRYVDGEFIITLNGRNAPDLHISRHYRKMLEKLRAQKKKETKEVDTDTKQFLKNKFDSARWFINSINQRRHTMSLVMDAIVQLQEDFFRYGEGNLKPMILQDVADIIDMDISTVSRVVNGKYVQTEFGVYELKYFFSEGLETVDGEEVSNKEVKAILQDIVDHEDKTDPMSDQSLADALEEKGFKIARRTVSKYRKQLGIPVARLRKEIVLDDETVEG
ncbi:RNA polymerase factor sigma-54 [Salisaeta longa]|uniref:RNA polymerase factor sigma-54 n=1 Tax=Salisaeta longa TaxID=503170 RepID=UPI0003B65135|nr:RNA polymerase factor sigma-54 [Salisaeta longa]